MQCCDSGTVRAEAGNPLPCCLARSYIDLRVMSGSGCSENCLLCRIYVTCAGLCDLRDGS